MFSPEKKISPPENVGLKIYTWHFFCLTKIYSLKKISPSKKVMNDNMLTEKHLTEKKFWTQFFMAVGIMDGLDGLDYMKYRKCKNIDLIWIIGPQKIAYIPSQDLASLLKTHHRTLALPRSC